MLDASGDDVIPVGLGVEVGGGGLFTLAHSENIVVVEQVARFTGDRVRAYEACELLGLLIQLVCEIECALAVLLCGDHAVVGLLDEDQQQHVRGEREQHDREEPGRDFAQAHAQPDIWSGASTRPLTEYAGTGR